MSCEKIKCIECNIVINELLCFVQNKIDIMDEESLIRLCVSTYTTAEITMAKDLLFESISTSTRNISRRRNREQKDLEDIICVFKSTDPDKTPIFVARELEKLPPVSFDHIDVTALLKDIVVLKSEMRNLKDSCATVDQLNRVKAEINDMKFASLVDIERTGTTNVNIKRGAYLLDSGRDSGPIGLLNLSNRNNFNSSPEQNELINDHVNWRSPLSLEKINTDGDHTKTSVCRATHHTTAVTAVTAAACEPRPQASGGSGAVSCSPVHNARPTSSNRFSKEIRTNTSLAAAGKDDLLNVNKVKSLAEITRDGEWKSQNPENEWILVQKKRLKNKHESQLVRGKAACMPGNKFKSASMTIPLFISNVHKDTSEKDIAEYVLSRIKEKVVLQKIKMKAQREYNAFKIMVPSAKLDMFLNGELWPADITCRRFRPYKNPQSDGGEEFSKQK